MPNTPIPLLDIAKQLEAQEAFQNAYGQAMLRWAEIEDILALWFSVITDMDEHMSRAVFHSATSFRPKLDMLYAAIDTTPKKIDSKDFAKTLLSKSRRYSAFRNALAHGQVQLNGIPGTSTFRQFVIVDPGRYSVEALENGITISKLRSSIRNFSNLYDLASDMLPGPRQSRPEIEPEEYRLRVHRLPTEAYSDEPNPNHLPRPLRAASERA